MTVLEIKPILRDKMFNLCGIYFSLYHKYFTTDKRSPSVSNYPVSGTIMFKYNYFSFKRTLI